MPILPRVKSPQNLRQALQKPSSNIHVSPQLLEAADCDGGMVLEKLQTSRSGLTEEEAKRRLAEHGPNVVAQEAHYRKLKLLGKALVNPLVVLLLVLAAVSYVTG